MKHSFRFAALFLALIMMLSTCLVSCGRTDAPEQMPAPDDNGSVPIEEYTLPLEEGYNQLTIYFKHNDIRLERNCLEKS